MCLIINIYYSYISNLALKIIPYQYGGVGIRLREFGDRCQRSCRCWRTKCNGTWSGVWRTRNSPDAPGETRVCHTCITLPLWYPHDDFCSTPCWRWHHTLQCLLHMSTVDIKFYLKKHQSLWQNIIWYQQSKLIQCNPQYFPEYVNVTVIDLKRDVGLFTSVWVQLLFNEGVF